MQLYAVKTEISSIAFVVFGFLFMLASYFKQNENNIIWRALHDLQHKPHIIYSVKDTFLSRDECDSILAGNQHNSVIGTWSFLLSHNATGANDSLILFTHHYSKFVIGKDHIGQYIKISKSFLMMSLGKSKGFNLGCLLLCLLCLIISFGCRIFL